MITIRSLFKYLRQDYAELLAKEGRIRIGTLYSFRAQELGPAIGDHGEGTAETTHGFDEPVDISRPENQSWITRKMFKIAPEASNIFLSGLSLVVPEKSPDCYIYCASHQFSRRTMSAFDADACVEIFNPSGFANALLAALRKEGHVISAEMAPCDYAGRNRSHTMKRMHPAFVKDASYRYQHEVRIIFQPTREDPLKPFVTTIPDLTRYCRLRSVSAKANK